MKSLMNNIKARWHLGCWMTTESEDSDVTDLFLAVLDKPWKHIDIQSHYTKITTVDNEMLRFWNANEYYGWASQGSISSNYSVLHWKTKDLLCTQCI